MLQSQFDALMAGTGEDDLLGAIAEGESDEDGGGPDYSVSPSPHHLMLTLHRLLTGAIRHLLCCVCVGRRCTAWTRRTGRPTKAWCLLSARMMRS